jgi:hypothetical protein
MKTAHTYLLAVLLFAIASVSAQTDKKRKDNSPSGSGEKCFNENTRVINLGVGFFGGRYYNYGKNGAFTYRRSPAIGISYEQAIPNKVGPGYLGLGAYFSYQTAWYRYDDWYYNGNKYYYRHNWTYMFFGIRAAYHADALCTDKAELYFGAVGGLRVQKYSYETNSLDPDYNAYALRQRTVYPGGSLFLGGRYYLTPNLGIYLELGYGMSYLTGGVSFKF